MTLLVFMIIQKISSKLPKKQLKKIKKCAIKSNKVKFLNIIQIMTHLKKTELEVTK
jgi:hypothetical protein